eukprot:4600847-Pleurochrysis_carterae.AAC.1
MRGGHARLSKQHRVRHQLDGDLHRVAAFHLRVHMRTRGRACGRAQPSGEGHSCVLECTLSERARSEMLALSVITWVYDHSQNAGACAGALSEGAICLQQRHRWDDGHHETLVELVDLAHALRLGRVEAAAANDGEA